MSDDTKSQSSIQRSFPTFRRLTSRRVLAGLGVVMGGVVTLVALYYAVQNWQGARAWKEVRDELRAQGEPLTFPELVPPMPPEDQNFAMTPFFKGFFDKSIDPKTGKEVWRGKVGEFDLPEWFSRLKDPEGWRFGGRYELAWVDPDPAMPKHAIIDVTTNPPAGVVRELMVKSKPLMDEIQTSVQRPYSQFPVHYEDNIAALLPHLAKLKELGRLFSTRALLDLQSGDAAAALRDVETTLALSESLRTEPILISGLVRIAILENGMQPVWQGLVDGRWSDAQLAELQSRLAQVDLLKGYQWSMQGERIFEIELVDLAERTRNLAALGATDGNDGRGDFNNLLVDYGPKGWYTYNKAVIARMLSDYAIPVMDPVRQRYDDAKAGAYVRQIDGRLIHDWKLFLARLALPAIARAGQKFALGQTDANLAAVACALERFKLKEGHYPESLAALKPDYLATIPHDIMDGGPLRYRQEDKAFVLYSIGLNGSDDGGKVGFKQTRFGKSWRRDEGDWAWYGRER
jgi:hypothetical protein